MVIVFDRHKAKRLQYAIGDAPHGAQNLCHTMHGTCQGLESDFDKVALSQGLCKPQQTTGGGNGLSSAFVRRPSSNRMAARTESPSELALLAVRGAVGGSAS